MQRYCSFAKSIPFLFQTDEMDWTQPNNLYRENRNRYFSFAILALVYDYLIVLVHTLEY